MAYPRSHRKHSLGDAARGHRVPEPATEVTFPHTGWQYQLIHSFPLGTWGLGARATSARIHNARCNWRTSREGARSPERETETTGAGPSWDEIEDFIHANLYGTR
jgi:hypothetical protein